MATSVGLNFRLTAAVDKFEASMKDVERRLDSIDRSSRQTAQGMKLLAAIEIGRTILGGISSIVNVMQSAASAATEMFNASRQATDAVGKLAASTGTAHEPLQVLTRVADHSGVSTTQFGDALQKLSRGLGEAANGSGTAKRALEQLGIPIDSLLGLAPEQQFMRIAAAIGEIEDPTKKSTVAADLFGRAGTKLIPMFSDIEENVKGTAKEMLDLGQVLSGTQITNVEAMNDRFSDVYRTVTGLRDQIVANIAPALKAMADDALALVKAFEYDGNTGGQALANYLTEAFLNGAKALADWSEWLINKLKDFLSGFSRVIADLLSALAALADWIPGVSDDAVQGISNASKSADEFADTLDGLTINFSGYVKTAIDSFGKAANEAADNTKKFVDGIGKATSATEKTDKSGTLFSQMLESLASKTEAATPKLENLAQQADATWQPLNEVKSTGSIAADAMALLAYNTAQLAGRSAITSDEVKRLGSAAKAVADNVKPPPKLNPMDIGQDWGNFTTAASFWAERVREHMEAWDKRAGQMMEKYRSMGMDPEKLSAQLKRERQMQEQWAKAQADKAFAHQDKIMKRHKERESWLSGAKKQQAKEAIQAIRDEWRATTLDNWRDAWTGGREEELFPGGSSPMDNVGLDEVQGELSKQTAALEMIRDKEPVQFVQFGIA